MKEIIFLFLVTNYSALIAQSQFQRTIGGASDDAAYSIIQTTDGDYAVAGWTSTVTTPTSTVTTLAPTVTTPSPTVSSGGTVTTICVIGIRPISNEIPQNYRLHQNYPNPFNPVTKIKFDIPSNVKRETSNVKMIIYDILGREVETLINEQLKPGTYEVGWDAANYPSGAYFYQMSTSDFTETRRMVLLK
jgi:Secretion system C-terminal sorting domain